MNRKSNPESNGFTIVEMLVVLVIATIVLSIAIPRIRTINSERGLRESARVVGSQFAMAAQRASIDGIAGVRITRNPNFVMGGFEYGATEISLLRAVPNFTGDVQDAQILGAAPGAGTVTIARPFEQDELEIIRAGDSISFNNSSFKYRITNVPQSGSMVLTLDVAGANNYLQEGIPAFDGDAGAENATYVIHRQPRVLRSSTTTIPQGYLIDLRYSGFEVLDGFGVVPGGTGCFVPPYDGSPDIIARQLTTVFEPAPTDFNNGMFPVIQNYDIDVIFGEEGSIEQIIYTERDDEDGDGDLEETVFRNPLSSLYFLITEAPDSLDASEAVAIADEQALWVSVSNNGYTNVGFNNSNAARGLTVADFSEFYFTDPDPTNTNDRDRDQFNALVRAARAGSELLSANQ